MTEPVKPEPSSIELPQESGPEKRQPKLAPPPNLATEEEFGPAIRLRDLDAEIENELQAAMSGLSEKELYGDPAEARKKPTAAPGRQKGKIHSIHGPDVFIDVPGGRSQGVMPILQFPDGVPAVGTEVEFHIEGYDRANGLLLLSREGAAVTADWSTVATGMIVEARVTATNKGGLSVDVNGIRGFMPISQIDLYRVEDAEQFVNQRLRCMVAEVDPREHNLVVSRRALLEKEREEVREKMWQEIAEGQIREGIVRSIREFGAFVDLGGIDGLLHVSEMSWSRIQDPNQVVQSGQPVKVVVLKVDREKRKVSLGLKQLAASPWDSLMDKFPPNEVVKAKITKLMDFGAFAELEPGIEGLIHISELAPQRVHRVSDIVKPGQEVQVRVLKIDPSSRKISLSIKAAQAKEVPEPVVEEDEPEAPPKPPKVRTTPLRGGIGESSSGLLG